MQKKALLLLLIAIIMGGVVTVLVNTLLKREVQDRAEQDVIKTTRVLVAASDLKTGMRLDKLTVKRVDWPAEHVPEGAYINLDLLLGDKPPIVIRKMNKNEIILPYKLSPQGARGGLPPKIAEDRRAITIEVSEISGVAGFVLPGTFVDVLLTSTVGQRNNELASRTLLQNVLVLGVDQLSSEDEDKPKVVNAVTLQVTPHDGKKLALGQEMGKLSLLLRNEIDASILVKDLVTTKTLLESELEPVKKVTVYKRARRTPTLPVVEIIRGLEVQKQKVTEGKPLPDATKTMESN
ncbi:MAG: Flp pilus assembly protein CpaB [Gammaproteobacteria bacterium]|nr:Flp pilus assembly protein CpaB [Gammaproteobacteria bacterium]